MEVICTRGITLLCSSLRRLVGISSVRMTASPSLVAPMNSSRLGWRILAAIVISRVNCRLVIFWNNHIIQKFCSHSETTEIGNLHFSPASSAQHLLSQLHLLSPHHPVGLLLPPLSDTHDWQLEMRTWQQWPLLWWCHYDITDLLSELSDLLLWLLCPSL